MVQTLHKNFFNYTKEMVDSINKGQPLSQIVKKSVDSLERFESEWMTLYVNLFNQVFKREKDELTIEIEGETNIIA